MTTDPITIITEAIMRDDADDDDKTGEFLESEIAAATTAEQARREASSNTLRPFCSACKPGLPPDDSCHICGAEARRRVEEHAATLESNPLDPVRHDALLGDDCLCAMCTVRLVVASMREV